jgi:hypothetical protein
MYRMRIRYNVRQSKFVAPIWAAIQQAEGGVRSGRPIIIHLDEERDGYAGEVLVELDRENPETFQTNWDGDDESRFPARIRAAATVLRDAGSFGRFLIKHDSGQLIVAPL